MSFRNQAQQAQRAAAEAQSTGAEKPGAALSGFRPARTRTPAPALLQSGPQQAPPQSAFAEDEPAPSLPIQLNALQALCRQVFGFRLAMITLGAPFALARAEGNFGEILIGSAVVFSLMGSYAMLRDWETLGPLVLKHKWLMAIDMIFGAVLLLTASPDSPLGYATVCTPLLGGLLYGWRGAGIYTASQILLLAAAYSAWADRMENPASTTLISGFCVAAGIIGVTLRNLMFRFGAATQALSEATSRLAVTEAVEHERARLAREMHDSVAKTLHGVAMSADALAAGADRMDPLTVRHQAGIVARSARRAAAESREILSDLRRKTDYGTGPAAAPGAGPEGGPGVDAADELRARAADFTTRTGVHTDLTTKDSPAPRLPHAVARQLLTIASEALENAHRHAAASHVTVEYGVIAHELLRLSVQDNGKGLPPGTDLDELRKAGHFGLVGMVERAASIGARIRIGRGTARTGTEVRLDIPLGALTPHTPTPTPTTP
ncbi:two-component sensor histidine kinase [Streptomyces sp. TRM66268-LWL]|uniref:Two-component sensor histidine kinase n=1 Tax=Streptomyces polyasparticus TaxID=2767826 RepID=A0ABR7SSI6_9ACTN|nr:two-component sensor histidine kinase [Streptomyces polyasparticus]